MLRVKEVTTKKELKTFVNYPLKLYKNNKYHVPDLFKEELDYFNPDANPAYSYCETKLFLAYDGDKVVGRIAAILNKKYNEKTEEKRMRFSRFDVDDNPEAAALLLKSVEDFAREKGMNIVHGPIGFSDLDKQGMLIEGFDRPDLSITLYNYPYYPELIEKNGYKKEVDWIEFYLRPSQVDAERLQKFSDYVKKVYGIKLLEASKYADVQPYLDEIFEILNSAYSHLYGYTPLNEEMQRFYFDEYFKLINFDYVAICMDPQGKVAAFGFAFPSIADALRKSGGKLFPFGFIRILRALKRAKVLELALIAVRKDYLGKGLNAVLINHVYKNGRENGIVAAETGPQLETNTQTQNQWKKIIGNVEQHKRRRCYVKYLENDSG